MSYRSLVYKQVVVVLDLILGLMNKELFMEFELHLKGKMGS